MGKGAIISTGWKPVHAGGVREGREAAPSRSWHREERLPLAVPCIATTGGAAVQPASPGTRGPDAAGSWFRLRGIAS